MTSRIVLDTNRAFFASKEELDRVVSLGVPVSISDTALSEGWHRSLIRHIEEGHSVECRLADRAASKRDSRWTVVRTGSLTGGPPRHEG